MNRRDFLKAAFGIGPAVAAIAAVRAPKSPNGDFQDGMMVWDRVLTDDEIRRLYGNPSYMYRNMIQNHRESMAELMDRRLRILNARFRQLHANGGNFSCGCPLPSTAKNSNLSWKLNHA
ncbi:MAG TPA: twin-arginine translocation signal domain-containing protein [Thermoguttaceae bacterium]|nr:twin-arginine translocation signal domain-containing protein [Thermoguttaceae bacterium]